MTTQIPRHATKILHARVQSRCSWDTRVADRQAATMAAPKTTAETALINDHGHASPYMNTTQSCFNRTAAPSADRQLGAQESVKPGAALIAKLGYGSGPGWPGTARA
jgi:hypothetical protein